MPKMDAIELRSLLTAQRWDSMSAITASKLSEERALSLDYYQGDMSRNMPAADGRSKAVSLDTSDTIEGMMPTLMEIFAGGDEVVRFDPVGPEDVEAAAQETDYVNHVSMQANQGFLILYSFIKDALLSKVGIVKIFWEKEELKERETYLDQPDDAFAMLVADPNVEVVEHSESDGPPGPDGQPQAAAARRLPQKKLGSGHARAPPRPRWHAASTAAAQASHERNPGEVWRLPAAART
jgi:hypothetical protein